MKKLKDSFVYYGITARMVVFFTILVIVPYLCLAGITYVVFQNYTVSSLGETTRDTVTAAGANIHRAMKEREEDSMALYYNSCVELLGKGRTLGGGEEQQIINALSTISYSNTGIRAAYLESEQGVFHSGGNYSNFISIMQPNKDEIAGAGGGCRWYTTNRLYGRADEYHYILARSLNNSEEKNVGILYLICSDRMVLDSMGELSTEYADWYLADMDGTVFYASDAFMTGTVLDVSMLSGKEKRSYRTLKGREGRKHVVAAYCLMDVGWFCVSVIDTQIVRDSVHKLAFPFIVISVIYVIFMFVMLYIMRKYVFLPLRALKASMDEYARNELGETGVRIYGIGEFRSLSEHFNRMTQRIHRLVEAYRQESEEKNRQKMKTLAAQLTPHFIYNALNTIKWVAVLNHQDKIQRLVESLISIFMNAARADDDSYTLKDELELIENYAVIQKARFMNFDLTVEVQAACMDCRIRKLSVQPIVENAIVHGLNRGKLRNETVALRAWVDGDLHITVTDGGVGFDVEAWRRNSKKDGEHTNIGLFNVEEMLRLEYGGDYGIEIESAPGKGTKVSYTLPVVRKRQQ
ncbi:histidine kinase [Lachnospiraceae bacterium 47-T17]